MFSSEMIRVPAQASELQPKPQSFGKASELQPKSWTPLHQSSHLHHPEKVPESGSGSSTETLLREGEEGRVPKPRASHSCGKVPDFVPNPFGNFRVGPLDRPRKMSTRTQWAKSPTSESQKEHKRRDETDESQFGTTAFPLSMVLDPLNSMIAASVGYKTVHCCVVWNSIASG